MSVIASADRRRRTTLVVFLTAALAAFGATVALDLVTGPAARATDPFVSGPGWATAAPGLVITVLAAVIIHRAEDRRIGFLLAAYGLFVILDGLAEAHVGFGLRGPVAAPLTSLSLWYFERLGALVLVGVPLVLLLYPGGRLLDGAWGVAGRCSIGVLLVATAAFVVQPLAEPPGGLPAGLVRNPTSLPMAPDRFQPVLTGLLWLGLAAMAVAVATVWVRHRRARGVARLPLRWLAWGALVDVLIGIAISLIDDSVVQSVLGGALIVAPAVAVTIGLVQPRLVGIDALLSGTLVYGLLAVLVLLVDLVVLAGLAALVGDALDQRTVVVVVLVLSTAIYAPLRSRLLVVVRRLVLGRRGDPYGVVAGLASSLERADDPAAQLHEIASAVARAFRVGYVSVEVDRSRGEVLVASHGTRPAEIRTLPVTYRGSEVGRLVLPAQGLRAQLSGRDETLLGDLVRQAAVAARTARLADDLQDSRERLILAREEERRRIRRDLHDGLGPALSGVVFRLEAARLQVPADPVAADGSLLVARDAVQDVVADVRRLVHELRPPALDDLGLIGALRQQAARLSSADLTMVVRGEPDQSLPAAVEVAAFRIASEAMANVARHARATHAHVELVSVTGELMVEVLDDGIGVAPSVVAGVGLVSLRERAAELGGRSEVVCPAHGGTRVRAWLPLRSRPSGEGS